MVVVLPTIVAVSRTGNPKVAVARPKRSAKADVVISPGKLPRRLHVAQLPHTKQLRALAVAIVVAARILRAHVAATASAASPNHLDPSRHPSKTIRRRRW